MRPDSSLGDVSWRLALIGVGIGTAFAPLTAAAIASVPPALAGLAGSANNSFRQTGGALGPAVLSAVLTGQVVSRLPHTLAAHHVAPVTAAHITGLVRTHGTGALAALSPGPATAAIQHAAGVAFAAALHTSATIGAIALLAGALSTVLLLRDRGQGRTVAVPERAPRQDQARRPHAHGRPRPVRRTASITPTLAGAHRRPDGNRPTSRGSRPPRSPAPIRSPPSQDPINRRTP